MMIPENNVKTEDVAMSQPDVVENTAPTVVAPVSTLEPTVAPAPDAVVVVDEPWTQPAVTPE